MYGAFQAKWSASHYWVTNGTMAKGRRILRGSKKSQHKLGGLHGIQELLRGMHEAGFNMAFLGIETPSVEALLETRKTQNTRSDLLESVRAIQAHGIEVSAGFIVGFDSDPDDIFDRQIEFIQQAAIPMAMVGLLNAAPGTELHARLEPGAPTPLEIAQARPCSPR